MYPSVTGEIDTVRELLTGKSIARYGDGELKILEGRGYSREPGDDRLTGEIKTVLREPHPDCLVAIPTMDPAGPKYENWLRHEKRFCRYVRHNDGRRYYSAFITRPDSAADRLESREYVELVTQLWSRKRRVTVLSEPTSKLLTAARRTSRARVRHVECPSRLAYSVIKGIEKAIVETNPDVVLMSCGPTATCMANRLAARGIQGLDLGSIGGLLMRWIGKAETEDDCATDGERTGGNAGEDEEGPGDGRPLPEA